METDYIKDIYNAPDAGRVIHGLRDTGYTFNTAVSDIIDNSIAANASHVFVNLNVDPQHQLTVYIADDGSGMDMNGLVNAMKYGSAERPNPSSLGKFGLGLKTASTSFCRKLSLVSTASDKETRKVQWDLDYVAETGDWNLKEMKPTDDELDILYNATQGATGTLVVWENIDRLNYVDKSGKFLNKAFTQTIKDLVFHLRATYQRFLDPEFKDVPNVIMSVNGDILTPWDPFCSNEPNTQVLADQSYKLLLMDKKTEAPVRIKAVAIPNKKSFSSPEAENEARILTRHQGFYIYRENRLIHYGDWVGLNSVEPHLNLLRIEFDIDHQFDDLLSLDIKKSKVTLNAQLSYYLSNTFLPAPKNLAQNKYRKGVNKTIAKRSDNAHTQSNRNLEEKAPEVEESIITITDESKNEVQIKNEHGVFRHKIKIVEVERKDESRVKTANGLDNGALWEPAMIKDEDGKDKQGVLINTQHPYYQKVYFPLLEQNVLVSGLDSLLWALAAAENATVNEKTKRSYEDFRIKVSMQLKTLLEDLPDAELDEESGDTIFGE